MNLSTVVRSGSVAQHPELKDQTCSIGGVCDRALLATLLNLGYFLFVYLNNLHSLIMRHAKRDSLEECQGPQSLADLAVLPPTGRPKGMALHGRLMSAWSCEGSTMWAQRHAGRSCVTAVGSVTSAHSVRVCACKRLVQACVEGHLRASLRHGRRCMELCRRDVLCSPVHARASVQSCGSTRSAQRSAAVPIHGMQMPTCIMVLFIIFERF